MNSLRRKMFLQNLNEKFSHKFMCKKIFFDTILMINRIIYDHLLRITHFVKIQSINNKTNFKHLKTLTKKIVNFFWFFLQINVKFAYDFRIFITHNIFNNVFKSIDIKIYFEIHIKNIIYWILLYKFYNDALRRNFCNECKRNY